MRFKAYGDILNKLDLALSYLVVFNFRVSLFHEIIVDIYKEIRPFYPLSSSLNASLPGQKVKLF